MPEIPNKTSFQANATNTIGIQSSKPPQQYQNQTFVLNLTSLVQQKHQRHMAQRRNENENRNPTASSSSSKDGSKRASTPLIGGFHFPSGIIRLHFCYRAGFEHYYLFIFLFEESITTSQLEHFTNNLKFKYRFQTTCRNRITSTISLGKVL